jgi:hypothetical protein
MMQHTFLKHLFCVLFIFTINTVFGQSVKQEKMEQLSILTGEWVGTSKVFENGEVIKQGPAFEHIYFDLDSNILVIQLNSEFLQLHTIVTYDESDSTYYYHPFYKSGTAKYPAEFKEGKLIVSPNEKTRFIFTRTPEGEFQEYGEKFVEGEWTRYFEDTFKNTQ